VKKYLLALAFPAVVHAAPFVYADVQPTVTSCGVVFDGAPKVVVPAVAGVCKYDLSSVSVGNHTISMTAIYADAIWGTQESAPSPNFTFTKPATPNAPTGLVVKP